MSARQMSARLMKPAFRLLLSAALLRGAMGLADVPDPCRTRFGSFSSASQFQGRSPLPLVDLSLVHSLDLETRARLDRVGVRYVEQPELSSWLRKIVRDGQARFQAKDVSRSWGAIYQIEAAPPARGKAAALTPAIEHPRFTEYMQKVRALGYRVGVDSSLPASPDRTRAYLDPSMRMLVLGAGSPWHDFLHEFQHLEFETVIHRLDGPALRVRNGVSLREILPPEALQTYGEKRIARMEQLIRKGLGSVGVNETLSVDEEIRALGWRRFVPFTSSRKAALNAQAYALSEQDASLREARAARMPPGLEPEARSAYEAAIEASLRQVRNAELANILQVIYVPELAAAAAAGAVFYYTDSGDQIVARLPDGALKYFGKSPTRSGAKTSTTD